MSNKEGPFLVPVFGPTRYRSTRVRGLSGKQWCHVLSNLRRYSVDLPDFPHLPARFYSFVPELNCIKSDSVPSCEKTTEVCHIVRWVTVV